MMPGLLRPTGMKQKIMQSSVINVLHRERLILAGFAVNASVVAMVVVHHG